jgi:hypothetical protein
MLALSLSIGAAIMLSAIAVNNASAADTKSTNKPSATVSPGAKVKNKGSLDMGKGILVHSQSQGVTTPRNNAPSGASGIKVRKPRYRAPANLLTPTSGK